MALTASYKIGTDEVEIYQDLHGTTYALNGIAVVVRFRDLLTIHTAATIQSGPVHMSKVAQVINHAIIDAQAWKAQVETPGVVT